MTRATANIRVVRADSLAASDFADLLERSGLAARRPADDLHRLDEMLRRAQVTVAAYDGDSLVGIARTLTDYVYCAYLSDLCVDKAYQKQGIGQLMIDATREAIGPKTTLILVAAPGAEIYYQRIGMDSIPYAFKLPTSEQ